MAANLLLRIASDPGAAERDLKAIAGEMRKLGKEKVQATVDVATEKAKGKVETLREELKRLGQSKTNVNLDLQERGIRAQIEQVQARLKRLGEQESSPQVDIKIGQASAQLERLQAKLVAIDKKRVEATATVDTSRATRALDRLNVALGNVNTSSQFLRNVVSLIKLPALMVAAGLAAQGVGALSAAFVGLGGVLAPASGGLVAFPGMLGAVAQAGITAKLAFLGMKDALKPLGEALNKPSPYAKELARVLKAEAVPALVRLRNAAQKNMMPGVIDGIRAALPALSSFRPAVAATGKVLGQLAREAGALVGSKAWRSDIRSMGMRNASIIRDLGRAGINFADVLRNIVVAGGPLISWMARGIRGFSGMVRAQAQAGRESGRMGKFFEQSRRVIAQLVRIGGNLAASLFHIGKAAAPLGRWLLDGFEKATKKMRDFTGSAEGAKKIRGYFDGMKPALSEAGKLIGALGKSFVDLSKGSGLAPLLKTIRTELLPVLTDTVKTTAKAFGPTLVKTLAEMVKLFGSLAGTSGPLNIFVATLGEIAKALNWIVKNVPGAKQLVIAMAGLAAVAKAAQFASWISGLRSVIGLYKKLRVAAAGAAVAEGAAGAAGGASAGKGATKGAGKGAATAGAAAGGGFLASFASKLKALPSRIGGALRTAGGAALGAGAAAGRSLLSGIGSALGRLPSVIGGAFRGSVGKLLGRAGPIGVIGGRIFETITSVLNAKTLGGKVKAFLTEGFKNIPGIGPLIRLGLHKALWGAITSVATAIGPTARSIGTAILTGIRWAITGVATVGRTIGTALATAIRSVAGAIAGAARFVANGAVAGVRAFIGAAAGAGRAVFNAVRAGIGSMAGAIGGLARTIAGGAVNGVRAFVGAARSAGAAVFRAVWGGIRSIAGSIAATARGIASGAVNGVRAFIGAARSAGAAVFRAVWGGIRSIAGSIAGTARNIARGAVDGVRAFIDTARSAGAAVFRAVWGGIRGLAGDIWGTAKNIGRGAINAVKNFVSDAYTTGKAIVKGLIGGIKSLAPEVYQTIHKVINEPFNQAKKLLKIKSPSKLWAGLGEQVPAGFALGIRKAANQVTFSARALVRTTIEGFDSAALAREIDAIAGQLTAQLNAQVTPAAVPRVVLPAAAQAAQPQTNQYFNLPEPAGYGPASDGRELLTQLAQMMRLRG